MIGGPPLGGVIGLGGGDSLFGQGGGMDLFGITSVTSVAQSHVYPKVVSSVVINNVYNNFSLCTINHIGTLNSNHCYYK